MNKLFAVLLLPYSAALVPIVLLGCATGPNESQQEENRPPAIRFVSEKTSKQVTACILDKWQHVPYIGPIMSRTTSQGYTIIQNAKGGIGADPAFISEIYDSPTGSETKFYVYNAVGDSTANFQYSVTECQ